MNDREMILPRCGLQGSALT